MSDIVQTAPEIFVRLRCGICSTALYTEFPNGHAVIADQLWTDRRRLLCGPCAFAQGCEPPDYRETRP